MGKNKSIDFMQSLKRAKSVTVVAFIFNGLALGTVVARIPDIKKSLFLTNAQVGISLLFIAVGVFSALKPAGKLCAKFGSRPIIVIGTLAISVATAVIAFSNALTELRVALFLLGYATATHDIAMNAHAVTLEKKSNQRMMGFFHANFSIGTLIGGVFGGLLSQFKISLLIQELSISVIYLIVLVFIRNSYLPASADIHIKEENFVKSKSPVIFWILGLFGLCAAMGEGAAGDWGGVLARESFNASPFVSTLPYIIYSLMMVVGRLSCDRLANRFGSANAIRGGGFISGTGLAIGLIIGNTGGVIFGWFCIGLGLSIVMPLIFSAAGELAHGKYNGQVAPSVAVARVSGTAYFGFMVGPPLIGFISDHIQLRWAMLLVVGLSYLMLLAGKFAKTD
jgi:MFS family permease